ncbi:MAG: cobyrinate a,c-diamide synthase [Clostridia bacterium]|nr:cobyrinate a,c-diamide synthase [Clostridia bacterium]
MQIPRIVIAGTNSGCGKTTVTLGIMGALKRMGLKVQPFKVGPDYIDPMFHTFITGQHSRNLDSFMLDENTVKTLFLRSARYADIAVAEGVMGFYDGLGGTSQEGSTAHVAGILNSPVVLVVNGEGLSLSILPILLGFMDYNRNVNIKGVILNHLKSESHFLLLKEIIEEHTGLAVLGYLKKNSEISLPGRHLGLVSGGEIQDLNEKLDKLISQIEKTVDLKLLVKLAGNAPAMKPVPEGTHPVFQNVKIGVAKDKAFNFYYQDNLELLEMLGADLIYFSPLKDQHLPKDVKGLYIGGGYPEVFAKELEENLPMKLSVKKAVELGLPAYAECGGLMYLSQSIKTLEGNEYKMTEVIPGKSEMTASLKRFGYVEVEITKDNILARKGDRIRAHEFHYSVTMVDSEVDTCYKVMKERRNKNMSEWYCGYQVKNLMAGYPHLHFWGNPRFAKRFLDVCRKMDMNEV